MLILIVRHWRSARGWSRRAMVPLVWLACGVGIEQIVTGGALNLPLSSLVSFGLAPLVMLAGPALFVISTVRARTAGGALGTAIVDLEPGASPGLPGKRFLPGTGRLDAAARVPATGWVRLPGHREPGH